jgi:hypothetical protein
MLRVKPLSAESHDNADGFTAKLTSGPGNVFRYAVSHNNIDDGWDLFTKTDTGPIGVVTIEDSLAYNIGTLSGGGQAGSGDRNGFKLGGGNGRIIGNSDSSHQFWSGTNGSRCANFSGALGWSFAADGRLIVMLGGRTVTL